MNSQQEVILDALVTADDFGGDYWRPGPLALVVQALHHAGLSQAADPADALGYPKPLCAAIEGAAWTLKDTDDTRKLAVTLISEVPPRQDISDVEDRELVEIAGWAAGRALAFTDVNCPEAGQALDLVDRVAGRMKLVEVWALSTALEKAIERYNGLRAEFVEPKLALNAVFFALHALRRLNEGGDVTELACHATRDTARLAGLRGTEAAAEFCLKLARQLGM
jgi:hypothetical protein